MLANTKIIQFSIKTKKGTTDDFRMFENFSGKKKFKLKQDKRSDAKAFEGEFQVIERNDHGSHFENIVVGTFEGLSFKVKFWLGRA